VGLRLLLARLFAPSDTRVLTDAEFSDVVNRAWSDGQRSVPRAGDCEHCRGTGCEPPGTWWCSVCGGNGRVRANDALA
jgi:DnaJ-class molecular chaperone